MIVSCAGADDPRDASFSKIGWTHRGADGKATTSCCSLCKSLLQRGWSLGRYKEFARPDREDGGKGLYLDAVCKDALSLHQ